MGIQHYAFFDRLTALPFVMKYGCMDRVLMGERGPALILTL